MSLRNYKISEFCFVTDYVANGSFASLKSNVKYKNEPDYAILLRVTDFTKNFNGNYVWIDSKSYNFLKKSELKPNDLIMANVGEPGKCFIVPDLGKPMTLGPNSILIRPDNAICEVRFLYYYFNATAGKELINEITSATTQSKFNKTSFRNLSIPLPPVPIQQKIAAILDEADALRRKDKALLAKYDELLQAVFYDMFGDPVKNEKGWEVKMISKIAETRLGKMLDGKKIVGNNLKPYLRNSNVQWFTFKLDDLLEMDFDEKDKIEFKLSYGDILMCEGGEIGRCAIWRSNLTECYFQKAIHRIRLNKQFALGEYFVYMFYQYAKGGGLNQYMGAATISHLTGEKLKKMVLPFPPLDLQREFEIVATNINLQKSQIIQQQTHSENLFQSLMQRAFKGELVG